MHRPASSESEGHGMRPSPSLPYLVSLLPAQASALGNFISRFPIPTPPQALAYTSPRTTCVTRLYP